MKLVSQGRVLSVSAVLILFVLLAFSGCSSLQEDILVDAAGEQQFQELDDIEEVLVGIRYTIRENGGTADAGTTSALEAVREQCDGLGEGSTLNRQYTARLEALRGLEAWLSSDTRRAGRHLAAANEAWELDEVSMLLESLLIDNDAEKLTFLESRIISGEELHRLESEQGNALFFLGRYGEAVAVWDAGLPKLSDNYRLLYADRRDKAWALKDSDTGLDADSVSLIDDSPISLGDIVTVTRLESELLDGINDGRDVEKDELFDFLIDREYLPESGRAAADTLRRDAAWFLWRLLARKESDPGMLSRFSSRFAGRQSPVPDLKVDDPWFDAALGCVQTEVMSLPDGRHFMPGEPVTGLDYISWLEAAEAY